MPYEFILGVDTEEKAKKVTIALVEKAQYRNEEVVTYHVRLLEQRATGDEESLVRHIQNIIDGDPYVGSTRIIINRTERTGRRLIELMARTGLTPVGATLSGGDSAAQRGPGIVTNARRSPEREGGFIVSEHDLAQAALDLYGAGQLGMEQDSPEVSALADGLQDYLNNAPEAGAALEHIDTLARRDVPHSGVVLATALACWYGSQLSFSPAEHYDEIPIRDAVKDMVRPDTTT